MPEVLPFFQLEDNTSVLRQFLEISPSRMDELIEEGPQVGPYLRQIIKVIVANSKVLDELCRNNIGWIGTQFISSMQKFKDEHNRSSNELGEIFAMAYRFLCELEFSQSQSLSFELRGVKNFVDENLDSFKFSTKRQLVFASYMMPAAIAREMLHHPDMVAMREFHSGQISAKKLKTDWDNDIAKQVEKVSLLSGELKKLETGFNFVGLVDGFRNMADKKVKEKEFTFACLIGLAIALVAPLMIEGWLLIFRFDLLKDHREYILILLAPLVAFELLLIYFFRVVLVHFRSLKAQLLQIELRTALCQFIQSYANYASEIKEKNASGLEKFENLIFSGLISTEENLPSTFDGTEQLAKLIGGLKK